MAEVAYNLEHFVPRHKNKKPPVRGANVRVAKRQRTQRNLQLARMVRTLFMVLLIVGLVFGVLYSQARLTEISVNISTMQAELDNQESLYTYLNFELESKTNLRNIEQRAIEMGLAKVDKSQMEYVRVEGEEGIIIRERGFGNLFAGLSAALTSTVEEINK